MPKIFLKSIFNCIHNCRILDSATIILVICLLVMVIIIGWNLIYNNNNKFITILSCIAIVIIVFCLISHINLLYDGTNNTVDAIIRKVWIKL